MRSKYLYQSNPVGEQGGDLAETLFVKERQNNKVGRTFPMESITSAEQFL